MTQPNTTQTPDAAPDAPETPDPADTPDAGSEADPGQESGQDDPPETGTDAAKRARREAAGLRQRAKAAEDQVSALQATLAAADDLMLASMLEASGLSSEAFRRAGPDLAELRGGSGLLDGALVAAAADQLRADLGLPPAGRPAPNPQQGQPSESRSGPTTLAETFSQKQRR